MAGKWQRRSPPRSSHQQCSIPGPPAHASLRLVGKHATRHVCTARMACLDRCRDQSSMPCTAGKSHLLPQTYGCLRRRMTPRGRPSTVSRRRSRHQQSQVGTAVCTLDLLPCKVLMDRDRCRIAHCGQASMRATHVSDITPGYYNFRNLMM